MTPGRLVVGTCIVGVVVMHFLTARIQRVSPFSFDSAAVEIHREDGWRYGYVRRLRDVRLVRANDTVDAPTFTAPDEEDALTALMLRMLRRRTLKTWAEGFFYAVLGLCLAGAAHVRRRWVCSVQARARSAAAAAAGFVTVALAPYALSGYGEPLFMSLYSASIETTTQRLVPVTGPIEPTVSYSVLVHAVTAVPLFGPGWFAAKFGLRTNSRGMLWIISAMTWAHVAWLVSRARSAIRCWWSSVYRPPARRDG